MRYIMPLDNEQHLADIKELLNEFPICVDDPFMMDPRPQIEYFHEGRMHHHPFTTAEDIPSDATQVEFFSMLQHSNKLYVYPKRVDLLNQIM